jgi:hypothetical protein
MRAGQYSVLPLARPGDVAYPPPAELEILVCHRGTESEGIFGLISIW